MKHIHDACPYPATRIRRHYAATKLYLLTSQHPISYARLMVSGCTPSCLHYSLLYSLPPYRLLYALSGMLGSVLVGIECRSFGVVKMSAIYANLIIQETLLNMM